jgi:ATP-binding cassette subfamily B protein
LFRLLASFSARRRRQFVGVFILMLAGAAAELVSIAAVLPFLQLVADPAAVTRSPQLAATVRLLGLEDPNTLVYVAAAVLVIAAVLSAGLRTLLTRILFKFAFLLAHDLGAAVFSRTIRQPYDYYVRRNSSEVLAGLEKANVIASGTLVPLMTGISSAVIAVAIVALLVTIDPMTAITAGVVMALVYILIGLASRSRVVALSRIFAGTLTARVKTVQESLGGIRDIILDRSHGAFERQFDSIDREQKLVNAHMTFLVMAPRYAVECVGILLIALLALYFTTQPGGMIAALPVLGALALGAQRLLPLLQNVSISWTQYLSSVGNIEDVVALLEGPVLYASPRPADQPIVPFTNAIELKGVGFDYARGSAPAVHGLDLIVPKGARIGFIGATGSGKSTLLDLVMGLLPPTEGTILIDGVILDDETMENWQAQVAHVPQAIFLSDDSIAANIAFGSTKEAIDMVRVRDAAVRADIDDFVDQLPEGFETMIGERGIRLSGGQRQRIGIARALYKRATVLILDEATSALDQETERSVMLGIEGLDRDLTLLVIAHRLSTIAFCDTVYRLEAGRIVQSGSYAEVVTSSTGARHARRN